MDTQASVTLPPAKTWWKIKDPRYIVASSLLLYLVLGFTILGFNRTPLQALVTTLCCMALEVILCRVFKGIWMFPLSAMITSFSLSLLLNYSHDYWLLLAPVFFAIATKYIFTFNGRHAYNPAQVAVTFSLLFCGHLITAAPAYQWYGVESIGVLVVFLGLLFVIPQVNRAPLVISFLATYTIQTLLRAWIMKHHLPFATLFLGSITSPAFFLFTFFMITDPATSPNAKKDQIKAGIILATLDLAFHLRQSYYTFFYAGFTLQSWRLLSNHFKAMRAYGNPLDYTKERLVTSGYWKKPLSLAMVALLGILTHKYILYPRMAINHLDFAYERIDPMSSGTHAKLDNTLYRTDPRLHHIIKWVLSVGDAVSIGDFDGDGLPDMFLTNVLKRDQDRGALYRNLGDFKFERVALPMMEERLRDIEKYGLPSNAVFVDYDNDGDNDLFILYGFGHPYMLQNQLVETGLASFVDVTKKLGLDRYINAVAVNFFDADNDGRLDIIVGNTWPAYLPDYPVDKPEKLNVFKLPQAEYDGDIRMFNFMHSSWHLADNGGVNDVWRQTEKGTFEFIPAQHHGMPEHFWTLAIGTADFNKDGLIDLYVANDFGPDNFYLNQGGFKFEKIEGNHFGDLGRDTYKGMNASVEDVNGDSFQDVYVSNVHHELQAEGSMLWFFGKDQTGKLTFKDEATRMGALNEDRFGWGGSIFDANNDGLLDIAQANGMVDDMPDKLYEECGDYWYTNEKIARSAPEIHRHINYWGDIRGYCIYPNEANRLYLNTGKQDTQMFVDVSQQVGMDQRGNSRGIASADLNNDGRMDMVVSNQFTDADILKNNPKGEAGQNNWIGFVLESKQPMCNRMALGSTIKLTWHDGTQERVVYKEHKLANGFSAQNDSRIHFGLGKGKGPVKLEVDWCQKQVGEYEFASLGQYHKVVLP